MWDGDEIDIATDGKKVATVLADPPWQFNNKTGKIAPEHRRLSRYPTLKLDDIFSLPIGCVLKPTAHLYLWCPNLTESESRRRRTIRLR
jgi:hypothetical protein